MVYTGVIALLAVVLAVATRRTPRTASGAGIVAFAAAVAAVAIAEVTGNVVLLYAGALAVECALVFVATRVVVAARGRPTAR
jgi:hypothetical protein